MKTRYQQVYLLLRSPEILAIWCFGLLCDLCGFERAADWAAAKLLNIVG